MVEKFRKRLEFRTRVFDRDMLEGGTGWDAFLRKAKDILATSRGFFLKNRGIRSHVVVLMPDGELIAVDGPDQEKLPKNVRATHWVKAIVSQLGGMAVIVVAESEVEGWGEGLLLSAIHPDGSHVWWSAFERQGDAVLWLDDPYEEPLDENSPMFHVIRRN